MQNIPRGRPSSSVEGARDAFDEIERFKQKENLRNNGLAARFGMTPSTVNRALESRESASWTPGFRKLYCNVQNALRGKAAVQRLVDYTGPGEAIVRRLLEDVGALVESLSSQETRDQDRVGVQGR